LLAFRQKQKEIEEINARLSRLESGVIVQKTEEEKVPEKIEKKPKTKAVKKAVTPKVQPKEAKPPVKKVAETKGLIDIGGGFFIKNLKLKPFGSSTYISGKIMNKSDRDYSIVDFKVQTYSEENDLLGDHGFSIKGFKRDSTKTFEEVIAGAATEKIAKYSIFPAEMPLALDTGKSTKMIEKKLQVAKAETQEVVVPKDLEELIVDVEKKGKLQRN